MKVLVMVGGEILDVQDVEEIPCVGEVVTIQNTDLVVTNLRLSTSLFAEEDIPILNLLPVAKWAGVE